MCFHTGVFCQQSLHQIAPSYVNTLGKFTPKVLDHAKSEKQSVEGAIEAKHG